MVFNGCLLYLARKAITSGNETPLSRSIASLYKEFDVTCFWWEVQRPDSNSRSRKHAFGSSHTPVLAASHPLELDSHRCSWRGCRSTLTSASAACRR